MAEVILLQMPLASLRWPSLGLGLLEAGLARQGIASTILHFNFDFAERIGLDAYQWLADAFGFVLGGERLFAEHYFGDRLPNRSRYIAEVLEAADPQFSAADRRHYESLARHVGPFVDACFTAVDWSRADLVGITSSYQQTMASLCLARRIKAAFPELPLVMGGAACEGIMGVELLAQFPELDAVFLGEADATFPAAVAQYLAEGRIRPAPGVVVRGRRRDMVRSVLEGASEPCPLPAVVADLDALPFPDFDDYFRRLERSPLRGSVEPMFFFETSRGCWWGQKHPCHFCGLNGERMTFRRKGPSRAVEELAWLVRRHGTRRACAADNILDHRYLASFLPRLREARLGLEFVYEMKTNLRRREVDLLVDAGLGAAQLGIESFSTAILRHIGKGASALQNIQALKWFSAAGVEVKWSLLYGFPGEDPAEYAAMTALLPSLFHLAPPLAVGPVRLDRFSPYFRDPAAFGIARPRAGRAYAYVFPFDQGVLRRLACYFEFDHVDGCCPQQYAQPLVAAVRRWQELAGTVTLSAHDREGHLLILHDTRPGAAVFQRRLTGAERAAYLHCDSARTLPALFEHLRAGGAAGTMTTDRLAKLLERWVEERIMARLDGRYLALALTAPRATPRGAA